MKKPKKPKLRYWKYVDDYMFDDDEYPSIDLSIPYDVDCTIYPDGGVELQTSTGSSHGDPGSKAGARTFKGWQNLLDEAKEVFEHYYGAGK